MSPKWEWVETPVISVVDGVPVVQSTVRSRHHKCEFGQYPWDDWERRAVALGIPAELVQLGRDVMREADQHVWSEELQAECGWNDEGAAMLDQAQKLPGLARERWTYLMETDGERGEFNEEGKWEPW
jgi:hypothetical protein